MTILEVTYITIVLVIHQVTVFLANYILAMTFDMSNAIEC